MCKECGCGIVGEVGINGQPGGQVPSPLVHAHNHDPDQPHGHPHPHDHDHPPAHSPASQTHAVAVHQAILDKNDRIAERNRGFFQAKGLLVLNVVSSPGSGKTTLVQKTAETLKGRLRVGVIVGDLATDNDAARLRAAGVPVVQITTGTVCHLEADMVAKAMSRLPLDALDVLVIENVGNLVCPATYDLGEDLRVVLLSVTEGEDKPLKYPPMFHSAQVAILNKVDLTAACDFDRDQALANLRRVSHHADVFELSARTGQGVDAWCDYLARRHAALRERQGGQRPAHAPG
jgi:hydrogenase nickel incorporation protein HypB